MTKAMTILFTLGLSVLFFSSCGGNEKEESKSKTRVSQKAKKQKEEMTIKKSIKLENEEAELLMEQYWDKFKGKKYKDVKNVYKKYIQEQNELYKKYDISKDDVQDYTYFKRDHRSELKEFRKNNPEYDYYKKYPAYVNAMQKLSDFASNKFMEEMNN